MARGEAAGPKFKVRAVLLRTKYSANGFTIAAFRAEEAADGLGVGQNFTAKGSIVSPVEGDTYLLEGSWEANERFGPALKIVSYERDVTLPSTAAGVRDYLTRKVKWIGPKVADAIIELYGEKTIEILRAEPERVAEEVDGLTLDRAKEISVALATQEKEVALEIAIRSITKDADLNQRQITAILKAYGQDAPTILKADPYRLIEEVSGVGWRSADAIAKVVGYPQDGPQRVRAGIIYTIGDAGSTAGHLYLGVEELAVQSARNLGLELTVVDRGVADAIRAGDLMEYRKELDGPIDVGLTSSVMQERAIAGKIVRFLTVTPETEAHIDVLAEMWGEATEAEGEEDAEETEEGEEEDQGSPWVHTQDP